jgi:hypothetical protein
VLGDGLASTVATVPHNRVRIRVAVGDSSPVKLEEVRGEGVVAGALPRPWAVARGALRLRRDT